MKELQSKVFLLQNEVSIIIKQDSFALLQIDKRNYKMGQLIYYNEDMYQKGTAVLQSGKDRLGQELLQSGVGNLL